MDAPGVIDVKPVQRPSDPIRASPGARSPPAPEKPSTTMRHLLETKPIPLFDFVELDNTIDEAKRMVENGRQGAFAVSARRQTKGRGRFDRVWHTPDNNVALTISMPRLVEYPNVATLPLMTGFVVHAVIEELVGHQAQVRIKWPNDILVDDAKISGTLIESDAFRFHVGIGINLSDEPPGARYPTIALGRFSDVERLALIEKVLVLWHHWFDVWSRSGFELISERYGRCLWRRGEILTIALDAARTSIVEGRCLGVTERGFLLIDVPGQGVRGFSTGDVGA